MSTLSEQHRVFAQQGRFERRMIRKSGTVASSRVADQESNERNENGIERFWRLGWRRDERNPIRARKVESQIYKDTKSQAAIVFHVDDPILAASHQETALAWNRIGEHMLLKAHGVMTPDRPIKYLSRQYLKVHTHMGDEDFKSVDLKNILTALRQPWKWLVVDREPSQGARNLDQQWDELAKIREHWERTITRDTELE